MKTATSRAHFEPRRVIETAAFLGLVAASVAIALSGLRAGAAVVIGASTGLLAFGWLERSLRGVGAGLKAWALMLGSLGRMSLWAAPAIVLVLAWGGPGGAGFLAGAVSVKAALLLEGIRSGGG